MKAFKKGKYYKYIKSDNILEEMFFKNLTYQQMAEKMGYTSKAAFSHFISGTVQPTISKIACLVNEFDKPVEHFFNFNTNEWESNQEVNEKN